MNTYRLYASLFLLLLLPLGLYSQKPMWTEYASATMINDIASDKDTLWLATESGLTKFNKKTLESKQYALLNTGLPSVTITHVDIDHSGVKWLGTPKGLVRFDGANWTVYDTVNTPLSSPMIRALCVGRDNTIWIATPYEMASLRNGTWQVFSYKDFQCLERVGALYTGPDGELLIAKEYMDFNCLNAYRWNEGKLEAIHDSLADRAVGGIAAKGNKFWFAVNRYEWNSSQQHVYQGTLMSYDGVNTTIYPWQDVGFSKSAAFHGMSLDSAGNVWVISRNIYAGGIARFDGTSWVRYNQGSIPISLYNWPQTIATDHEGVVWVGTYGGNLLKFNGTSWDVIPFVGAKFPVVTSLAVDTDASIWATHFQDIPYATHFEGDHTDTMMCPANARQMLMDSKGVKWLVTDNYELFRWHNNGWAQEQSEIRQFYIDRSDNVWAITTNYKVKRFDGSTWKDFSDELPADFQRCTALTQDKNGAMWFGTAKGLWKYSDGWTYYPRASNEMPDNGDGFLVMACDSSNALWLGNSLNTNLIPLLPALMRFDGSTWTSFPGTDANHKFPYVVSIVTDKAGNVWVAGDFLQKFDGTSWTRFDNTNSPVPATPRGLVVDQNNILWMQFGLIILGYNPDGTAVSVVDTRPPLARDNGLSNYPNPSSSFTTISYIVPEGAAGNVQLKVYNALGIEVATLVDGVQQPGTYSREFNTAALPEGVYFYKLQMAKTTISRQLIIVR